MKRRSKSKTKSMDPTNSTRKRPQAKKQSFLAQMIGFRPPIAVVALIVIAVIASVYYVFTTQAATAWPLKVSSNNRYLTDQNNKPFLFTADTAWSSLSSLSVASAKQLIDLRHAQGYNAIMGNISGFNRTSSGPHGSPFQGDDLTRPNEAYFQAVDEIIKHAASKDMVVLVGALWMADNGGRVGGRLPSTAELESYGSFLGNRYKNQGNVMWFVGGDDEPNRNLESSKTLGRAINAADPNHLITYHTWGKAFHVSGESWLDLNAFQWNSNSSPYSYQDVTEGYGYGKPIFDMEPAYDPRACCGSDQDTSLQENRRNGWWAILSGAMGVAYGGPSEAWNAQEPLNTGAINRPGATHTANIRKILEPYPWEKLVPDNNNGVVIGDRGDRGGYDYVTAGRADDGSLIVAYTPNSRTLIVNMSQLAGPAQGYWVDPTNGTKTSIGANLPNSGNQSFTSPGQNAGGDSDFVLILSTGAQSPTSPSVPTTVPTVVTTVLPTVALVTPTLVCLGSCPTLVPSGATPGNPIPTSSTVTPTGQVPTNDPSQPEPTIGGNPTVSPQPGGGGGNQQPQGIIGWFLALLALIIQFFLSLFGR